MDLGEDKRGRFSALLSRWGSSGDLSKCKSSQKKNQKQREVKNLMYAVYQGGTTMKKRT